MSCDAEEVIKSLGIPNYARVLPPLHRRKALQKVFLTFNHIRVRSLSLSLCVCVCVLAGVGKNRTLLCFAL